ncbi:KpsF/GutQ family sugar-phosphate isomerase [Granulosicoccaceae sp. 1_MG-2023]|nr:KpsF/GutQ family sugar-phosphate isomerase [Granulosicoccaceae sp. 1_MG-2023]
MDRDKICRAGRAVIETEAEALNKLASRLDANFAEACQLLFDCRGRIVVSGMGKSGHIAGKIAATLASTGSAAFFVHPGEAGHGDLGMVREDDVFVGISYSGNSEELLLIMPTVARMGVPIVTLTGNPASPMAELATVNINVAVDREACPLGLAPTASTTATLAMGDALAIALLEARGFSADDFALSHPSGTLGRRLLLRVSDIMATGDRIPQVSPDTTLRDALVSMTAAGFGMTIVVGDAQQILGIFTDGDLRRAIDANADLHHTPVEQVMTRGAKTIANTTLAAEALGLMETHRINALPVVDEQGRLCGALKMHDLLSSGVV